MLDLDSSSVRNGGDGRWSADGLVLLPDAGAPAGPAPGRRRSSGRDRSKVDRRGPPILRALREADRQMFALRPVAPLHAVCTLRDLPLHQAVQHPHVAGHLACLVEPGFCAIVKDGVAARSREHASRADALAALQQLSPAQKQVLAAQAVSAIAYLHSHGFLCMYGWAHAGAPWNGRRGALTQ